MSHLYLILPSCFSLMCIFILISPTVRNVHSSSVQSKGFAICSGLGCFESMCSFNLIFLLAENTVHWSHLKATPSWTLWMWMFRESFLWLENEHWSQANNLWISISLQCFCPKSRQSFFLQITLYEFPPRCFLLIFKWTCLKCFFNVLLVCSRFFDSFLLITECGHLVCSENAKTYCVLLMWFRFSFFFDI